LFPHILLGVLALLSAGCQSDDAGSDLPQETAAENPQPASSSSEQNAAGESVEDQPSKETHFPIRIRLTAELPTEGADAPKRSVSINSLLEFSSENLSVLDDSVRTREWISGGVNPDPGGSGTPAKNFHAYVEADDDVSGNRLCTLLDTLAQHELITRLTLVEDRDEETVRPGRDFEITFLKEPVNREEIVLPPIRVGLKSADGEADPNVFLGSRNLGNGDAAFSNLNREILKLIGSPHNALLDDMQVDVSANYDVRYGHMRQAIRAVSGRKTKDGRWVTYIRNVALDGVGASRVTFNFGLINEAKPDPVKRSEARLPAPAVDDRKLLLGKWYVTAVETDGMPDSQPRWSGMLVVEDTPTNLLKMTLQTEEPASTSDLYVMSMAPQASPKQMDISFGGPGSLARAIYQLDENVLTICVGEDQPGGGIVKKPRPGSFKTKPDDGHLLIRLRRASKAAK